jgi:hypothetical protein
VARDDRLDRALFDGERRAELLATPRTDLETDLLDGIDPRRRSAMMGLVALHRSALLALFLGALGNVRPSPVRRSDLPVLQEAHLLFEIAHQPAQKAVLFLEESILLEDELVVLLVYAPAVGGEHDRPNLTALAHATEGSASRI